jgi:hypothetical protein
MEFAVGAGANDRACVPDFIAHLEQRHVRANRRHDAGCVIAENLRLAAFRIGAHAHLGVDRVDRDGLHPHQKVATKRGGLCDLDVDQRFGLVDRQRVLVADSAHEMSPQVSFDRFGI